MYFKSIYYLEYLCDKCYAIQVTSVVTRINF